MRKLLLAAMLVWSMWVVASCGATPTPTRVPPTATPVPPTATPAPKIDMVSVARGGLLYDKWWKVTDGASEPTNNQALWALQTTNTLKGSDTWRCKECHGWDYRGKDGAYSKGSHYTGFPGVRDAGQRKPVAELASILGGSANAEHNFSTVLKANDINDLANFLKYGLVDMSTVLDYAAKKPIAGDAAAGKLLFGGVCAACHGDDGKKLNFGSASAPEYIGTVAVSNPFEFLHKTRVGQPASKPVMPSTLVLGWTEQQMSDVIAYAQSLPQK